MEANEKQAEMLDKIKDIHQNIFNEIHKVIIGQDDVIEQIIISILAGGHSLLLGVPGLGKTLLVKTIAQIFDLDFNRIQFTPDLMPADIFGTEVIEEDQSTGKREFRFIKGPIFSNIILADEINRTPPKTQSALLEAMGEGHITVNGETYDAYKPFFVLATQNPIELEGTYPLPEAQLDRFLLNILLDYLPKDKESEMVMATTSLNSTKPKVLFNAEDIVELQKMVREVAVSKNVIDYAVNLSRATRPDCEDAPEYVKKQIKWGAGSRASQALIMTGKARALLKGRYNVSTEDVRALALPVLRHRVITNFHADAEGISVSDIIKKIIQDVKTD